MFLMYKKNVEIKNINFIKKLTICLKNVQHVYTCIKIVIDVYEKCTLHVIFLFQLKNVYHVSEKMFKYIFKKNIHCVFEKCSMCTNKMFHLYSKNIHHVLEKVTCIEQRSNWWKMTKKQRETKKINENK